MNELKLGRVETAVLILIVIGVAVMPFAGSRMMLYNFTLIALYATVVTSLNMLLRLAGQASFAQTTFMAIGGYGNAILTTRYGLNPWLAMLVAVLLSLGFALLIG